ncbi:hypothetical protein [Nocardia amikacinitolerans]|uniref:hypothetical protein n=1 Tax=Nocardia amikacinitolerans TaxID=756689 RepID=UPI001470CDAE|nr:hypothetical protein [Nocardia amikacinitolerans]
MTPRPEDRDDECSGSAKTCGRHSKHADQRDRRREDQRQHEKIEKDDQRKRLMGRYARATGHGGRFASLALVSSAEGFGIILISGSLTRGHDTRRSRM